MESDFPTGIAIGNVVEVNYQGTQYNSSTPNPSGWTMAGLETDFGIAPTKWSIAVTITSVNAEVEDAIEDSLDILDEKYSNIYEISKKPVFFDSLEVRQVIADIKDCHRSVLVIANKLTKRMETISETKEEDN